MCYLQPWRTAEDMIFDRGVELAQPHEYSWRATPYDANIRKSIQHNKLSHKLPDIRTVVVVVVFSH